MSRTPEQHVDEIRSLLPQPGSEMVDLNAALDRRTAGPVKARWDSPRFDNSQMDGYALSTAQLAGGTFPVGPTVAAGVDPATVYPVGLDHDSLCPIMTGARLPSGTAAVVAVEKTQPGDFVPEGTSVTIPSVAADQFMRLQGSDIHAGEEIIPPGTELTPVHIALLASQSITSVEVVRRLRIITVTGGAEIAEIAEITESTSNTAQPAATIPDANGPLLYALARRHGIEVLAQLHTDDNPARLADQLERAIDQYQPDAVITSGGISHGKFEVIRQVLEPAEGAWFGHVDQQPGGPQGLAVFHGTPVIALPGNPISTLVSFALFIPPVLRGEPLTPIIAEMGEAATGLQDTRDQFLRGRWEVVDGCFIATPLPGTSSHLLARGASATCLIRIRARTTVEAGNSVEIYPLG